MWKKEDILYCGTMVWLVASSFIFKWFPEKWVSLDGDVSMFVGQTINYSNIMISFLPFIVLSCFFGLRYLYTKNIVRG